MLVAANDVTNARRHNYLRASHARRADTVHHNLHVLHALADKPQGVNQCREHDDSRAVLVIVKDWNVQLFLQALFNLKAARGGYVFQVDSAESRLDVLHRPHNLVRVFCAQTNRKRIHARELFEEHRLAFHHRHRRRRPYVA